MGEFITGRLQYFCVLCDHSRKKNYSLEIQWLPVIVDVFNWMVGMTCKFMIDCFVMTQHSAIGLSVTWCTDMA